MEAEELRWRSEELPRAIAERQGNLAALGLLRWAAVAVRIRDTEIELQSTMSSVASFPR